MFDSRLNRILNRQSKLPNQKSKMDINLISVIVFASCAVVGGTLMSLIRSWWQRAPEEEAAPQQLRRLPKLHDIEAVGLVAKFDAWFERTLSLSGWSLSSLEGATVILLLTLTAGGSVLALTDNLFLTLLAVGVSGFVIVVATMIAQQRRLAQFEQQFPSALDLLARAVRAGESLEQSLTLVGDASAGPVGVEMRRCSKQLELGLPLSACMRGLTQRIRLMDVRIFGNAVAVHREAGGDLPLTLDRLAAVIRDRQRYQAQLKGVTAAGRLSSILILVLGPVLFLFLFFGHPEYGQKLLNDPMGQYMLGIAVVLQVIGVIWVTKLLKSDY